MTTVNYLASEANAIKHIFQDPLRASLSLLWGLLMLGTVLWLPNIELVGAVLGSEVLSIWAKFWALLGLYRLAFSALGFMQLIFMLAFTLQSVLGFGVFLTVMGKVNRNEISHEHTNRTLLALVFGGGLAMAGMVLLTPVITVSGLIFGTNPSSIGLLIGLMGLGISMHAMLGLIEIAGLNKNEPLSDNRT